ncbi:hypothetical protein NM04_14905 [Massilia aurea]|uniref:Helix-turn-helix domain-containing protein n=1 Tax=Massilia aurea TaxID=373040 RepID=A0A422QJ96_9BURK|nr:hypothetical protein [Massilia aurea]RNF30028.1 hypothetical protein NM04_14905 [Massilia aurea]
MSELEERDGYRAAAPADEQAMAQARRTHVRMMLIQQFHLDSAFIGVPKLAGILGLSPSTVWGYIRERKFFIPYRLFNKSPVVCIDDLVDWYCASDAVIKGAVALEQSAAAASRSDIEAERDSEVDDAVAQALASIGIDPKSKRGSLRPG